MENVLLKVGPGDGYELTVEGFDSGLSNLRAFALSDHSGMKFSTW